MRPLCVGLLLVLPLPGQTPEFDFYRGARDQSPASYAAALRTASIPEPEIACRLNLLKNHRPLLGQ